MKVCVSGLLCLMLLTGCVGVIPVPSLSNKPVAGCQITSAQASGIIVGRTTRSEVVEQLGNRFRESPRMPALAYSWELPGGRGFWWAFGTVGGRMEDFEWSRWRAFFILFDGSGRVADMKFVRLASSKSLDEQLEDWARQELMLITQT